MGNISRIRKQMSPKIAMADAHISVNGCQVFLGHPDPAVALSTAKSFKAMFINAISRSRCMNLHDMYEASFSMKDKILNNEKLWN